MEGRAAPDRCAPGPAPGDSAKTNLGHIHTRKPSLTSREIKEPDTADGFIFGKERAGAGFQGQPPASRWAEPRSVAGRGPSSAFSNLSGGVWPSSLGSSQLPCARSGAGEGHLVVENAVLCGDGDLLSFKVSVGGLHGETKY